MRNFELNMKNIHATSNIQYIENTIKGMIFKKSRNQVAWILYFDISKCSYGTRVIIILVSHTNEVIPMAYKHWFEYTNIMSKYEALILR